MTADAPPAEVADAFRQYALRHHPDRGGDPTTFQDGVEAYRTLSGRRRAPAELVFHRRARTRPASLLRLASRRLASFRPR